MHIQFQTAFDLYLREAASVDEVWKFYSAVTLTLLGSVVASDKMKSNRLSTGIIIGGFAAFAFANAVVLYDTQEVAYALAQLVGAVATTELIPIAVVPRASHGWEVALFHVVCDIAFICAVWVISEHSRAKSVSDK